MANVRPFRGVRYSSEVASHLGKLICPPFDVISPQDQETLRTSEPHNAIHLELPEGEAPASYENAAGRFHAWHREGVLVRDGTPSFYVLRHSFSHRGVLLERWGLTAAVQLEEYESRVVLPHEETQAPAKEDRFQLMQACRANFSPIMSLYRDGKGRIREAMLNLAGREPDAAAQYGDDHFSMWVVPSDHLEEVVNDVLEDASLFIADGHHRYETALRYRDWARGQSGSLDEENAFNYVMMTLIEFNDAGLLVLPYHRTLGNMDAPTLTLVREQLLSVFDIQTFASQPVSAGELEEAVRGTQGVALGLLGPDGEGPYLLKLENERVRDELRRLPGGDALHDSEGWILHQVLMYELGDELQDYLQYVHDPEEAWSKVVMGERQMAFFLKAFPLDLFRSVVGAGQRLPPKSTYFHPKLPTGMVFNPLEGRR